MFNFLLLVIATNFCVFFSAKNKSLNRGMLFHYLDINTSTITYTLWTFKTNISLRKSEELPKKSQNYSWND